MTATHHYKTGGSTMHPEKILVADDSLQISQFLAKQFLPNLGYRTAQAFTGRATLEAICKQQPDLLMLDLQLPDISGLDVLRELSKEGRSVPTILMTAHGSEQIAAEAFHLGVQDYLPKPFDPDELESAIVRALTGTRLMREKALLSAQLREQVSWLTALSKVGRSVTSTLQLDEVLRRIVEAGVYLTHAEEGFLALADNGTEQLYLRASKNIEEERTRTMRLPMNDSLVGEVIKNRRPVRISKNGSEAPLKVSTGYLVRSLLHVPILSRGQPLGVLSVDSSLNQHNFMEKDEAMLASLADYAAIAIENARLYEQAQEEIAERRRAEMALRESEERYALAVRGTNDGIWDWDLLCNEIYYSPRWKSMLGYDEEEIKSSPKEWFNRVHPEDDESLKVAISAHLKGATPHFEHEHRMLHKDGTYRWILCRGFAVWNENRSAVRIAGSQSDITDRKRAEEQLIHNAFFDTLTGLPNRELFRDRLQHAINRRKRHIDDAFAVFYLDLDRFKNVNDSLGHLAGDRLLVTIADILKSALRNSDTVARLGGDEFVILAEEVDGVQGAMEIAERILEKFSKPILFDENEVFLTASIGIVFSCLEYEEPEQVLRDADIAMYAAKSRGRARAEVFEPDMRNALLERLSLEHGLRRAIYGNELRVYYQPIVSLKTRMLVGFEALVRWMHPARGLLLPADFLPVAEDSGLILALDRWVLKTATCQLSEWLKEMGSEHPLTVSVNLSTRHISQIDLVEEVRQILEENELEGKHLKLEITESALLENSPKVSRMLGSLREMGVQVHIDDFGTGYSSLAYLHQFPVQALKIDRSFILNPEADARMPDIVKSVVRLAHDFGMEAVAEGVENEVQLGQLLGLGCEYVQGAIFSLPMDKEHMKNLLNEVHLGHNPFEHIAETEKSILSTPK